MNTVRVGQHAESYAEKYLSQTGYCLLERNYRTKVGEIDLIAFEKGAICFIEVKMRSTDFWGEPSEAVNRIKQRKMALAAQCFLKSRGLADVVSRFDVVSILIREGRDPEVILIRDAFQVDF